eukprot:12327-Heterococcus_DN1.PRE.1
MVQCLAGQGQRQQASAIQNTFIKSQPQAVDSVLVRAQHSRAAYRALLYEVISGAANLEASAVHLREGHPVVLSDAHVAQHGAHAPLWQAIRVVCHHVDSVALFVCTISMFAQEGSSPDLFHASLSVIGSCRDELLQPLSGAPDHMGLEVCRSKRHGASCATRCSSCNEVFFELKVFFRRRALQARPADQRYNSARCCVYVALPEVL